MKENRPVSKQQAYGYAWWFWKQKDFVDAEIWALRAMKLGSRKLAPELLAEIALETRSKDAAATLSNYYYRRNQPHLALQWANTAKEFGSQLLADKLIAKITAHIDAITLHHELTL